MPQALDLGSHDMVALSRASIGALRTALERDASGSAAAYLQEAGYAGGDPQFESFRAWLAERHGGDPETIDVGYFAPLISDYFRETGWGTLSLGSLGQVAALDSHDWREADPAAGLDHPACHLSTGIFAAFFGRLAGQELAVFEVECRSAGAEQCRWLVGSPEMLEHLFGAMEHGAGYAEALGLHAGQGASPE